MARIIALWWGEINEKTTLKIDKEIIDFSWKKNPRLLFIPTASGDSEGYYAGVQSYFWSLWCKTDVLYLTKNRATKKIIEEKILWADIIYVWWGNTLKMMTLWRKLGVDKILKKALKKNIVLSGLSAWAICWFNFGNSDSRKFTSWSKKLIKVTWLWFVDALHCPHRDREKHRQNDLKRMMKNTPGVAIALEDDCAIQIKDNQYRILTSKRWKKAYKVYWKMWKFYKEEIIQSKEYSDLEELVAK